MVVPCVVSGGISLLSSSLMPYRTLLTSCDDMNVHLVPLYQLHTGKALASDDSKQHERASILRAITKLPFSVR